MKWVQVRLRRGCVPLSLFSYPFRLLRVCFGFVAEYVDEQPFSMQAAFAETSPSTPVMFVLFPGVDPTVWVEELGARMGITTENGKFLNISMGQGQEAPAEAALEAFAESGGWIMLQNVHLMQRVSFTERGVCAFLPSAHSPSTWVVLV